MKVITIGNGFIASHLPYEIARYYLMPSFDDIAHFLDRYKPSVLINCIGKTGSPNIDWCETHRQETYLSNTVIPLLLAEQCEKRNIYMVQIASGCVFSQQSPHLQLVGYDQESGKKKVIDPGWQETDPADPQSFYSHTKYAADLILGSLKNVVNLRIRMPVSELNHSRNLINKLKGYQQIIDIPNSMTFTSDLVKCIDWAITNRPSGIFHVANSPTLTAARIMREYQKYRPHQFQIISGEQLDQITAAKRSNCVLNTDKLTSAGFSMTDSERVLEECMKQYVANLT